MTTKFLQRGIKQSLFSLFLVLVFCSVGIGMATANPTVTIVPASMNVNVSDDFSVFISVDPDGQTVETILASITYDQTKASVVDVIMNSADFPINSPGDSGVGVINNIAGLTGDGLTTTTNLAEIKMHASHEGTFTVGISGSLTEPPGDPLTPVDWNPGQVTIEDTGVAEPNPSVSIVPSTQTVCLDDDFSIYIRVDPNGQSVETVLASITFDETKASVVDVIMNSVNFQMNDPGVQSAGAIDDISGLNTDVGGLTIAANLAEIKMQADSEGTFTIGVSGSLTQPPGDPLTPVDWILGQVIVSDCAGPRPVITEPDEGDVLSGNVTITEVDASGRTIVYNLFQYSEDGSTWTDIANDTDGSDGWSADWDTMGVADGDYFIGVTMGDDEGLTGSDQILVTVANPPEPRITRPSDGAHIRRGTTLIIEEVDDSGQGDIVSNKFEYSLAGADSWTEIGTDNDGSDGWSVPWNIPDSMEPGEYDILATMTDSSGNEGTDMITIMIVTEGIPLYQGWNLFSVPATLDNSSVEYVLEGLPVGSILMYYNPSVSWQNVDDIEPLKGYMLYVPSEFTIVNLEPKSVPPAMNGLDMFVGMNLIGLTGYNTGSAEDALVLGGIDDSYEEIQNWDATAVPPQPTRYGYNCNVYTGDPCPPAFQGVSTEDFMMYTYEAYWVEMVADDVYTGQG